MEIVQRPFSGIDLNCHPVLQRIFAARGITEEAQLDKRLQSLHPFHTLSDMDKAVARLEQALNGQEHILIIGDFDADGATSSALAVAALRSMGAQHVNFLVPNRFEFGYGLTPGIVEIAKTRHPHLIITVDNGIANIEGVALANEAGIDVLITDHHLPAETLPNAYAIVNPNRAEDNFPSKSIAGVGVIFYVMLALRRHLSERGWFVAQGLCEPNMAQFLDLVALGTVADMVALDHNNRILVNQGIARIRQGLCRPGIQALIAIAGKQSAQIRERDLGFSIAPRLNAAGRLDDMSLGIECLLAENISQATALATQLEELNIERRKIETQMKEQTMLSLDPYIHSLGGAESQPLALCLVDPSWHQGLIGLLAGRLKDRYHRPVIACAVVSNVELKGSARSIPGLNIRDVLAQIDKDHPRLMTKFGGHAMAAGLSLHPDSFVKFQQAFISEVEKHINLSDCKGQVLSDGGLEPAELNLELAHLLQNAGPWGQQFSEPMFDNIFEVLEQRLVGTQHLKLSLKHTAGGDVLDAIAFNVDLDIWPDYRIKYIHAAYKLDVNIYRGRSNLQLVIDVIKPILNNKNI